MSDTSKAAVDEFREWLERMLKCCMGWEKEKSVNWVGTVITPNGITSCKELLTAIEVGKKESGKWVTSQVSRGLLPADWGALCVLRQLAEQEVKGSVLDRVRPDKE